MLNKANFEEMVGGNANRRRMRNGGEVPKGYHKMPDGSIMKDSDMVKKTNGGSMTNTKKTFKETIMPGTNRGMKKNESRWRTSS